MPQRQEPGEGAGRQPQAGEEQLREVALVKIIVPAQKSNPRWEATRQLAPMIRLGECQRPGPSIVPCSALSVDDA